MPYSRIRLEELGSTRITSVKTARTQPHLQWAAPENKTRLLQQYHQPEQCPVSLQNAWNYVPPRKRQIILMKMTAFWDVAPCCLVELDRCFRGEHCHQGDGHPDDGDSTHLSNVCLFHDTTRRYIPESYLHMAAVRT
jgi:hypothetical protein